jgi:hypothetical protein
MNTCDKVTSVRKLLLGSCTVMRGDPLLNVTVVTVPT